MTGSISSERYLAAAMRIVGASVVAITFVVDILPIYTTRAIRPLEDATPSASRSPT